MKETSVQGYTCMLYIHVYCIHHYIDRMNINIYPLYIDTHTILSTTSHPKVAYLLTTRKLKTFPISLPIFEAGTWSLWNRWIVPRCWEIPVGFGNHGGRQNRSTVHTLMYGRSHRNTMKTIIIVFVRCLLTIFLTKKSKIYYFPQEIYNYKPINQRFFQHTFGPKIPKPLPKGQRGNSFWLGGLPAGWSLMPWWSVLLLERRETRSFGKGNPWRSWLSCGMGSWENVQNGNKDGMKQKDQMAKCHKWIWTSCSWIGFAGCELGISLRNLNCAISGNLVAICISLWFM